MLTPPATLRRAMPRDTRDTLFLLGVIALIVLPQTPNLPLWCIGLTGAVLLLCSDIAARLVHTNPELRLGVFTSLLGTPFFFWLVVRIRKVAP